MALKISWKAFQERSFFIRSAYCETWANSRVLDERERGILWVCGIPVDCSREDRKVRVSGHCWERKISWSLINLGFLPPEPSRRKTVPGARVAKRVGDGCSFKDQGTANWRSIDRLTRQRRERVGPCSADSQTVFTKRRIKRKLPERGPKKKNRFLRKCVLKK